MEWVYTPNPIEYLIALNGMHAQVLAIQSQQASEMIWALQHFPVFTAGTSAKSEDLINNMGLPIHQTGRGGQYTYHGPGQLILYIMINLNQRNLTIKSYINLLEKWVVESLKKFGIEAEPRKDRIGLWVTNSQQQEEKIAAIGVRISKGITSHGLAINLSPNLDHFKGIIPCGLKQFGVASAEKLGRKIDIKSFSNVMKDLCPFRQDV